MGPDKESIIVTLIISCIFTTLTYQKFDSVRICTKRTYQFKGLISDGYPSVILVRKMELIAPVNAVIVLFIVTDSQ